MGNHARGDAGITSARALPLHLQRAHARAGRGWRPWGLKGERASHQRSDQNSDQRSDDHSASSLPLHLSSSPLLLASPPRLSSSPPGSCLLTHSHSSPSLPHSKERTEAGRRVLKAFNELVDLQIELDESAFKHALRACDISADWRRALTLLDMMVDAGMKPDTLCYGNTMSACARNGRAQTVLQLMSQMRTDGLQPNAFCYNAAVGAASRAGKWRQSIGLLDDMEEEASRLGDPSLAPTKHTYTAALKACALTGQSRAAQNLLQRMQRTGFEPESYHFGTVIDACGRAGDMGKVMWLMRQMEVSVGWASEAACTTAEAASSTRLLPLPPPPPSPSSTFTLLHLHPPPPSPSSTFSQERGLQPDVRTFTTALTACARENQLNRALSLIERMYKLEVRCGAALSPWFACRKLMLAASPFSEAHACCKRAACCLPKLACRSCSADLPLPCRTSCWYTHACDPRTPQVPPDVATYNVLLQACDKQSKFDIIAQLIESMPALGVEPNIVNCTIALALKTYPRLCACLPLRDCLHAPCGRCSNESIARALPCGKTTRRSARFAAEVTSSRRTRCSRRCASDRSSHPSPPTALPSTARARAGTWRRRVATLSR